MKCITCHLEDEYCVCDENLQERIADALERIAKALETQNPLPMTVNYTQPDTICGNHIQDWTNVCPNCGRW